MRKIVRRIYVDIIVVVLVFVAGFLTGTERAQRLYKDEQAQAITELRQRENQIRNDYDEIIQHLTEQQKKRGIKLKKILTTQINKVIIDY